MIFRWQWGRVKNPRIYPGKEETQTFSGQPNLRSPFTMVPFSSFFLFVGWFSFSFLFVFFAGVLRVQPPIVNNASFFSFFVCLLCVMCVLLLSPRPLFWPGYVFPVEMMEDLTIKKAGGKKTPPKTNPSIIG